MSSSTRRNPSSARNAIQAAATPSVPASPLPVPVATTPVSSATTVSPNTIVTSSRSVRTIDYLVNERLADKLPNLAAKNASEFMAWAYSVKGQFSRIPGFQSDLLSKPRSLLTFGAIAVNEIEFLYQYMWERLYPVVSILPGVHSKLTKLLLYDVNGLWKILNDKFLPMNEEDRKDRGDDFRHMTQGSFTIHEFTDRVLAERDILTYLGITKDDNDVRRTICKGLQNREAKQFALLSDHIPFDDFIEKLNRYDHILDTDAAKVQTALLTEDNSFRYIPLEHRQCFHCYNFGHIRDYCPDLLIPQEELQLRKKTKVDDSWRNRGGRSGQSRGYNSGRGPRGRHVRGRNGRSYYQSQANVAEDLKDDQEHVALAEVFSQKEFDRQAANFDWTTVPPFDLNESIVYERSGGDVAK